MNRTKSLTVGAAVAAVLAAGLSPSAALALESKTFVVGWFSHATNSVDGDCGPGGPNPTVQEQYLKDLADLGMSGEEIEALIKERDSNDEGPNRMSEIIRTRGRINGEPANPYMYPATVKDPGWKALVGTKAYGFDLDGKGPDQRPLCPNPPPRSNPSSSSTSTQATSSTRCMTSWAMRSPRLI